MPIDLSVVKRIAVKCGATENELSSDGDYNLAFTEGNLLRAFQACYAMGAQEQKERDAKICEQSAIPFDIDTWHGSTKKKMTELTALALAVEIRKSE